MAESVYKHEYLVTQAYTDEAMVRVRILVAAVGEFHPASTQPIKSWPCLADNTLMEVPSSNSM